MIVFWIEFHLRILGRHVDGSERMRVRLKVRVRVRVRVRVIF